MFNFNENTTIKKENFGRGVVEIPLISVSKTQINFNKYSIVTFGLKKYDYIQFIVQDGMLAMKFSKVEAVNSYKISNHRPHSISVSSKQVVRALSEKYLSKFRNGINGHYSFRLKQESEDVFYVEIEKGEFKISGTR